MIKKSCTLQLLLKDSGIGHISKVTIYGEIPIMHLLITRCVICIYTSFSKSYHFPILFQYSDEFYLTWLHNVTVVDTHTKQISTCLHTMTCVYTIVGFFFYRENMNVNLSFHICLIIIVPPDSECCRWGRLFQ